MSLLAVETPQYHQPLASIPITILANLMADLSLSQPLPKCCAFCLARLLTSPRLTHVLSFLLSFVVICLLACLLKRTCKAKHIIHLQEMLMEFRSVSTPLRGSEVWFISLRTVGCPRPL